MTDKSKDIILVAIIVLGVCVSAPLIHYLVKPKDAIFYFDRGNVWYAKGEFDKAIVNYTKAIKLDPDDAAFYNNRGAAWAGKGEFDKAIADYDKAIELDPDGVRYNNRGLAWAGKGEFDNAIADYDRAIELDPKDTAAYYNRGNAWAAKDEFDKALADHDKAIELDPKDANCYLNAAEALITLGRDFRRAVERLEQGRSRNAFESDRDHLIAHYLEGIALALNGEDASAAEAEALTGRRSQSKQLGYRIDGAFPERPEGGRFRPRRPGNRPADSRYA